ncbi:MAG TPA: DUF4276 family protein [Candidatus Hydrogenedentes bacterium]|nr:DUF4276 family protein [Candidatus Hydrogenedentota bacterium]
MNEVGAIMEGETELAFVQTVLAPYFQTKGITIWARLPGRVNRQGGVQSWSVIRGDIVRTLKERSSRFCTTMFDYYAMPRDWPGRFEASELPWDKRGAYVERAIFEDLAHHMGSDFRQERFIPYVQMHEFEAILFSDVRRLGAVLTEIFGASSPEIMDQLHSIVVEAGSPEAIDDSPNSAPSKRIISLASGYKKTLHGILVAQRIQLPVICASCLNFNHWITRLEALGTK